MDMYQNPIHSLLVGLNIINLQVIFDIEIWFKCHASPNNWSLKIQMVTMAIAPLIACHVQFVLCNYGV
jgi:hypothetical protein